MATIYSLICWGGKDGKTVTFTDSGDVVNLTAHGLRNGAGVAFSTTGALPTGLTAGTTYYTRQGADANKFTLFPTSADAIAGTNQTTFTGTGSGTHTAKGAYYLSLADKTRWTTEAAERTYDGLVAWFNARKLSTDYEVAEIADAFTDTVTGGALTLLAEHFTAGGLITTVVNGSRSAGFHAGVVTGGYILYTASGYSNTLSVQSRNMMIDGINGLATQAGQVLYAIAGNQNIIKNCIGKSTGSYAFAIQGFENQVLNNLGYDSNTNFIFGGYYYFHTVLNNTSVGGTTGFNINSILSKTFHNNVAVGATNCWTNGAGLQVGDYASISPHFCEVRNNVSQRGGAAMYAGGYENGVAIVGTAVSIPVASPAIVTWAGHGKTTGDNIKLSGTTIGAGLTKYRMYFLGVIDADTFYLYDTYANAIAAGATGRQNLTGACTAPTCVSPPAHAIETLTTDCFVDYAGKDFRPVLSPATGTSLVGNAYTASSLVLTEDMLGYARPGYNPDGAEYTTLGCFGYDQGHGPRPATVAISITGIASGSILAVYKTSDMSEIIAPQSTTGSYSGTYTYTADTAIIVRVRKGTSGGKYLPYEYAGTITAAGFNLNVSQIIDPIA